MRKNTLVIIDPQNDFVDKQGALSVGGAAEDMDRVADLVRKHGDTIDDIQVTLDSHHAVHIAHPLYWVDSDGNHPDPFTLIELKDVKGQGAKFRTTNPAWQDWGVEYVRKLEGSDYKLCIWPEHCLIGSWGHSVWPNLFDALLEWEKKYFGVVNYLTKGSNMHTEHYSVVKAEVVRPDDPTTDVNTDFIKTLQECDDIFISGEASSHCVANSVIDIADQFGDEHVPKFVYLEDASSPVAGFETLETNFLSKMNAKGMRTKTTETLF